MSKVYITGYTLLAVGAAFFLAGLLGTPVTGAKGDALLLQPSPRPTTSLPTLRPTTWLPTLVPTASPVVSPTAAPTPAEPKPPPPAPTSTPVPIPLPPSGGTFQGGWLLGLGIGLILLGFTLTVLQGRLWIGLRMLFVRRISREGEREGSYGQDGDR